MFNNNMYPINVRALARNIIVKFLSRQNVNEIKTKKYILYIDLYNIYKRKKRKK